MQQIFLRVIEVTANMRQTLHLISSEKQVQESGQGHKNAVQSQDTS